MPLFSLLSRIRNTSAAELQQLVGYLEAQTNPDWELILVVSPQQAHDRALVADITALYPRVRMELRPDSETLHTSVNALLPGLGAWTGLLGARDGIAPDTLAAAAVTLEAFPEVKVLYTDEESHNRWGVVSRRFDKGELNPLRLRAQDYLRDLVLVRTAWLTELGGFDRTCASRPMHDIHLQTLDSLGPSAFMHIPGRRYYRHRDHRLNAPVEAGFDEESIRRSLERTQTPARIQLDAGTATLRYAWTSRPAVTVLPLLSDDAEQGLAQLLSLSRQPGYRMQSVRALHRGNDPVVRQAYQNLCKGWGWTLVGLDPAGNLPMQLNQQLQTVDDRFACLLQGTATNPSWLDQLVDHALLPGVAAVGARIVDAVQLRAPGVLGYRFDGWDWNTRGRFNELAVPHQIGALSPYALLLDVGRYLAVGGFDPTLPTLYGMDLTMRLDGAGQRLVWVPGSQVQMALPATVAAEPELVIFSTRWSGWVGRFGLHQPIE